MSVSLVAHTIAQAVGTQTSSAIDTTSATFLVLSVSCNVEGVVSDSKSNTWTQLTVQSGANTFNRIYYVATPIVGSGHTFTVTGALQFCTMCVAAFKAVKLASPFDQQNGAGGNLSQSLATGSVTPTTPNQLLIASCAVGGGAVPPTIDTGFTITDAGAFSGGVAEGGGLAYLIATAIAATNPTWSCVGGNVETATIATFKSFIPGLFEVF